MGIKLSPSLNLSHMFYADDAVFVEQWCDGNINTLVHVLECFYRVSGLQINMSKSKIMGVHVEDEKVKYAASELGVPLSVLRMLESIRSHFFNVHELRSNKATWVKWNSMLASKEKGGLGVNVFDFMRLKLGNGDTTAFWEDNWIGGNVLKDLYPRIYALETGKSVTVSKKLTDSSLDNSFRRKTRGGVEQSSGEFFVASVQKVIDEKRLSNVNIMSRLIKCVPTKVNVLAWKIKVDALPNEA
nr:RNA-directed DNA polymerase, eukaryota, reverse transcriptase zinc-binding domain protein [Tanacetum cinerariifolium]